MEWLEAFKIFGTIAGSGLLAWRLPKYYIDKEAKEPIDRLSKEIDLIKKEMEIMKLEIRVNMKTISDTKTILIELSTKISFISDSVKDLTKEVMTLIRK